MTPSARQQVVAELEQLGDADRTNRIGRTVLQVGIPASLIGVLSWAASLAHIDLDPGPGTDLPAQVTNYLVALGTALGAYVMNRRRRN